MKCSVSNSFEAASSSSDFDSETMPVLNDTFELTSEDIRLVSKDLIQQNFKYSMDDLTRKSLKLWVLTVIFFLKF